MKRVAVRLSLVAYAAGGANYLAVSAGALEIAIIIQGAIEVL